MVEEAPKPRGRAAALIRTGHFIKAWLEKVGEDAIVGIHWGLKSAIGRENARRPKAKWLRAPTYESFVKYFGHLRRLRLVELVREEPLVEAPHERLLSIRDGAVVKSTRRIYRLSALGRAPEMQMLWDDPLARGLMRQALMGASWQGVSPP